MNSTRQDDGCTSSVPELLHSPPLPPSDPHPPLQRKRTVSLLGVTHPSFDATGTSFAGSNAGQAISFEAPSEGSLGAGSGFMRVSARSETLSVTLRSDDEGTLVRSTVVDIDEPYFCNGPSLAGSLARPTMMSMQPSPSRKPQAKPRRRNMTLGYISESDDDEDLFTTFRSLSPQSSQCFASRLRSSGNNDSPPPRRAHVDAAGGVVDLFDDEEHSTSPTDDELDKSLNPLSVGKDHSARRASAGGQRSHSSSSDSTGQQISVPCMDADVAVSSSDDDPELDRPPLTRHIKSTADGFFAVDCPLKPD